MNKNTLIKQIHYLLLFSIIGWFFLAINLTFPIQNYLLLRGISWSGVLLGLGYLLWLFPGVYWWFRIRKILQGSTLPVPAAFQVSTVFLFFLICISMFLWVFHFSIKTNMVFFLVLHFGGPIGILLARLSFLKSWEKWDGIVKRLFARKPFDQAGNYLLMLFSVFIFLIIIEGSFSGLTGIQPESSAQYGDRADFVLSPYLMFAEPDIGQGGQINTQGFYGPELELQKDPLEKRIAMVGGSTVYAGKNYGSISSNLEELLQERYPKNKIKVINFGRMSYISMQELILLERNILPLHFDLIIVFDGFNDIWVPYKLNEPVGYPSLFTNLKKMTEIDLMDVALNRITLMIKQYSALANFLSKKLSSQSPLNTKKEAFGLRPVLDEYERNLFQMAVLAKAYSAKIMFVTQPFVGTKKNLTAGEKEIVAKQIEPEMIQFYQDLISSARKTALKAGAIYVDATDVFDDLKKGIYSDPVHFHLLGGNPIVAKRLAGEITNNDVLK